MSYELSVIIPVYNVEKYIGQCLDSVVNQSIGIDNIEVIIVNDKTPDNSMEIVKTYVDKYPSFKVINNENNQGLGLSRNIGLSEATSDYVTFLDSDDFISSNTYKDSIDKLKKSGCDLLIYNWEVHTDDGHIEPLSIHNQSANENKIVDDLSEFPEIFFLTSAWNKIYHKSLFKYLNYKKGLYEDNVVTANVLLNANKIFLSKDATYYYRKNASSITENISIDNVFGLSQSIKELFEFKDSKYFPQIKLLTIKFLNDIIFWLYYYYWNADDELMIVNKLKESVGEITKKDLDYFNKLFPDYPTFYPDECLNLNNYDADLFLAKYKYYNRLAKINSQAAIYLDLGDGFSEQNKIAINYRPKLNNVLTFDLSKFDGVSSIRFDPLEGEFISCKINNLEVLESNSNMQIDGFYTFKTLDPNFILKTVIEDKLIIDFDLKILTKEDISKLFIKENNIIEPKKKRFKFL